MNEYSRFGAAFSLLNRCAHTYFEQRLRDYGIGPAHQAYLLVITPGEEINQDEIARRHQVDKANAGRAVVRLERMGYLTRRRAPFDRRNWLVSLTPRGEQVRVEIEAAMTQWVEVLMRSVSRETWNTMVAGMEEMAQAAEHHIAEEHTAEEQNRHEGGEQA